MKIADIISLALALCLTGCDIREKQINKFSDPLIVKIADLKDRRLTDSLLTYFNNANAVYRREAVEAIGSIQDFSDIDRIGKLLLMDPDAAVRKAAAFALGQLGERAASERLLLAALVKEKVSENTFVIFQAYGKTTSLWKLDAARFASDSLATAGFAWSLYRAGLRGKTDSVANSAAAKLLAASVPKNARLGAAHFFARGATDFARFEEQVRMAATKDSSPEIRMAAVQALGKIPGDRSLEALKDIIQGEQDARVLVNAVRALRSVPYNDASSYLYEAAQHKNEHVAIAASEVIVERIQPQDWIEISSLANSVSRWRIRSRLLKAALKASQREDIAEEIQGEYRKSTGPYERAAWLGSLEVYPPAFAFVAQELAHDTTPLLRSTAAAAIVAMNYSAAFSPGQKAAFGEFYKSELQSEKDVAVLGTIATALADSTLDYRELLKDPAFLYSAKGNLKLPEHLEALQPIEDAIAYFEGRKPTVVRNEFNHPIDWALVKKIPEDQRATIKTERGNIVLRLFVNEAPGSVANFVALANQNYFRNKVFHRVVPNFVVQAGCNRGDGWGSEPYSIRSEFSTRLYKEGTVGMASAGKDTEGTQWFITHSPTPHLDGRYTIFAEVEQGMNTVNFIQVGDKIIDVVVENFNAQ